MKNMFQFAMATVVAMSMTACSGNAETADKTENDTTQQEQVQPQEQAQAEAPTSFDSEYFSVSIPEGWVNTGGEKACWLKKFKEGEENRRIFAVNVVPLPALESVEVAVNKLMENTKYEHLEDLKVGDHTFAVIKRNNYLYWLHEAMPKSGAVRVEIQTYDKENPVDLNNPEIVGLLESLTLK